MYKSLNAAHSGESASEDIVNNLNAASTGVVSLTTRSLPDHAQTAAGEVRYTPLTTRALQEHDLQQAAFFSVPTPWPATRQDRFIRSEAVVTKWLDSYMSRPEKGCTGFSNSMKHSVDTPSCAAAIQLQPATQQNSVENIFNEADPNTCTYQSTDHRYPHSSYQDNGAHTPGIDEYDIDPAYWKIDSKQDVTAWGNVLAGVGEHLAKYSHPGYANDGGLILE